MIGNVLNNQNISFGKKVSPEKLLGIKHANIKYTPKELESLDIQTRNANLEAKLDIAQCHEKSLIAGLKKDIAQLKQKLNLFA